MRGGDGSDFATVDPLDDVSLVENLTVLSVPPLVWNPVGHGVVAQADGKVIVVGSTDPQGDGNTDFLVARFHANGSIDRSFGVGGVARTDVNQGNADVAYGVTVGRNGKIIVVGSTVESGETEAAVVRYDSDGTLDTSFSDDGTRTTGYAGAVDIAYDVLIDAAGRIVLGGASGDDFLIGRLNSNGSSDPSFSDDGMDRTDFGGVEAARGVALLPNGQIVAGGYTTSGIGGSDFAAALYDPDTGTRVPPFGSDGKRTLDLGGRNDAAWGVAVDSKGRIVLGGTTSIPAAAAVRMNPIDGSLDPSFGGDGFRINRVDFVPGNPPEQLPATGGGVFISSGDSVNFAGAWRPEWHIARVPSWGGLERDADGGPPPFAAIAPAPNGAWVVALEDFSLLREATRLPIVLGSDGRLVVQGTAGDDVLDIRRTGVGDVIVSVNHLSWQLDMDDFTSVRLNGGNGNDRITITNPITDGTSSRPVTLDGGDGDDTLMGNDGDDVLEGGDGNDHLEGAGGSDRLSDAWGDDSMFGGTGEDSIDGGYGDDFLDATDGAPGDTVEGGPGTDTAEVNPGDSAVDVEIFA